MDQRVGIPHKQIRYGEDLTSGTRLILGGKTQQNQGFSSEPKARPETKQQKASGRLAVDGKSNLWLLQILN